MNKFLKDMFSSGDSVSAKRVFGGIGFVCSIAFIQAALADNPNVKIMFVTPPNRFTYAGASVTPTIIDNVRNAIKALADKYNAPVCDLAVLSNINDLNYTTYKADGVHPVDSDRPRLASILSKFIETIA